MKAAKNFLLSSAYLFRKQEAQQMILASFGDIQKSIFWSCFISQLYIKQILSSFLQDVFIIFLIIEVFKVQDSAIFWKVRALYQS